MDYKSTTATTERFFVGNRRRRGLRWRTPEFVLGLAALVPHGTRRA